MNRNWMGALVGLSVVATSAMAAAAPGGYYGNARGNHGGGASVRGGYGGASVRGGYGGVRGGGAYRAPAVRSGGFRGTTYGRPVVVRPSVHRPVVVRPVFHRPIVVRAHYRRPVVITSYHRGWISRLASLRLSAYNYARWTHYSIAARQAELARLEAEVATIQANQPWLMAYGDYGELVRQIVALRASLGIYAPAPTVNLSIG